MVTNRPAGSRNPGPTKEVDGNGIDEKRKRNQNNGTTRLERTMQKFHDV